MTTHDRSDRWGWGTLAALMLATTATMGLMACGPRTDDPGDGMAADTSVRSVSAPLCTDNGVIISEPCSLPMQDKARAAQTRQWKFFPHKGDDRDFQIVDECPKKGGAKLPCMAVPRAGSDQLAGVPTLLLNLTP